MTIKLWDWDAKWALKQTFEGHIHYVMQIAINPKDNNTFASASLDRTVKVVLLGQGGKGETPGVCTPLILHPYCTGTPLEEKYQWSTTGVEWSIAAVEAE